jgi:hypothetical protein
MGEKQDEGLEHCREVHDEIALAASGVSFVRVRGCCSDDDEHGLG